MIDARDLHLRFGETSALSGVDLSIQAREVVALVGASGSGKSSLLYCLSGLLAPTRGTVAVDGQELTSMSREGLAEFRRTRLGFVFQFSELVPELTLRENVAFPLELVGTRRAVVRRRTDDLLEALGIADRADVRPAKVSGGQAQRAAVARAIAHRPAVLLADEPTGALDTANAEAVLGLMLDLARDHGTTVVLVTHDDKVAAAAQRSVVLHDGRTVTDLGPGL